MDVFTILKDESTSRRFLQIDLDQLANNPELVEDLNDIISIELRKSEEEIPWELVKLQSKNKALI